MRAPAAMPVASPCTLVCTIDAASGLCVGCARTLDEIARWGVIDDDERRAILAAIRIRSQTMPQAEDVRDNTDDHRFELTVDGALAYAAYRLTDDRITFIHTVVPPELEGRGIGSDLIHAALENARSRGLSVVAECSFGAEYIDRHPEYRDLLA